MRRSFAILALLTGCDGVFGLTHLPDPGDGSVDADIDAPDDTVHCYGTYASGALFQVCTTAPAESRTLTGTINTGGTAPADCDLLIGQGSGPEVCVVIAKNITISTKVGANGSRPLVLVATNKLLVDSNGEIDVSSRRGLGLGAGANDTTCPPGADGTAVNGGSGGGAGGSFGTAGGNGGSSGNGGTGGAAAPGTLVLGGIRGGCKGGSGNTLTNSGASGGAMYLIAGDTIEIDGTLDASGQGGGGTAVHQGGGGGGSGGLIALDSPHVIVAPFARVVANGGGGGGGGDGTIGPGAPGFEADLSTVDPFRAAGGMGGGSTGGGGGRGCDRVTTSLVARGTMGTTPSASGGGGGGGGEGMIRFYSPSAVIDSNAKITPKYQ